MIKKQASQAPIWGRSMGSPWLGPSCLQLSNQWGCGTYSSRGNPIGTMDGLTDWPTVRLGSRNSCVSESILPLEALWRRTLNLKCWAWNMFWVCCEIFVEDITLFFNVGYVLALLWDGSRRYQPGFSCLRSLTLAGDGATLVDKTHHLFFFRFSLLWALQRIMPYEGHWRPVASHMNIIT